MMNTLCVLLALSMMCQGSFGWGAAERDLILKMHNDYRRGTVNEKGACHMNQVEYDQKMEDDAKAYAQGCVYQHKFDKYGENFAYNTNKESDVSLIQNGVEAWYGEISTYTYGQNACGPSGTCHYTQVVAASLTKMGCYAHWCPNLVNAAPNAWFFVCYYTPKGNWVGEDAYPKKCDTPCKKGQTEENKLCTGEAEDESEKFVCKDTTHYCSVWAQKGQCERNPTYMKAKCPVACKECTPEAGDVEATDSCLDNDPRCPMWSKRGECTKRAEHMKTRCPKSCKHC